MHRRYIESLLRELESIHQPGAGPSSETLLVHTPILETPPIDAAKPYGSWVIAVKTDGHKTRVTPALAAFLDDVWKREIETKLGFKSHENMRIILAETSSN